MNSRSVFDHDQGRNLDRIGVGRAVLACGWVLLGIGFIGLAMRVGFVVLSRLDGSGGVSFWQWNWSLSAFAHFDGLLTTVASASGALSLPAVLLAQSFMRTPGASAWRLSLPLWLTIGWVSAYTVTFLWAWLTLIRASLQGEQPAVVYAIVLGGWAIAAAVGVVLLAIPVTLLRQLHRPSGARNAP